MELRAVEGADAGMRMALGEGGFVGRGAACRFRLSDPSVQSMHASVRKVGDRYVLTDVSGEAGLLVNDLPVKSRPLQLGDRIRIGLVVLEVRSPEQSGDAGGTRSQLQDRPPVNAEASPVRVPSPETIPLPGKSAARAQDRGMPVWIVSSVIAAIVAAVVVCLWLHLMSLRRETERQYLEVEELAKSGRMTSLEALDRYRGILVEAGVVHPRMAERLKVLIRSIETELREAQARMLDALSKIDAAANELAARGEYAKAADAYRNADSSLKKIIEDLRTGRIAELDRLAAGQAADPGKRE